MVVTLPPENVMFPETSSWFAITGFCITAFSKIPFVILAVDMLALVMVAVGMVVVPVNVASFTGAFNKFNESSAFLRSRIS